MTTTTTTTDDPSVEYHWNDWTVRHRTDNRSQRPWTIEHVGRRIATFNTAESAKRTAQNCIREDHGKQTAVRWKQINRTTHDNNSSGLQRGSDTPPPQQQQRGADLRPVTPAGWQLLDALANYIHELRGQG